MSQSCKAVDTACNIKHRALSGGGTLDYRIWCTFQRPTRLDCCSSFGVSLAQVAGEVDVAAGSQTEVHLSMGTI